MVKLNSVFASLIFVFLSVFSISNPVLADKGSVSPWPISISQDSQRAIIIHNFKEEVLILGTELRADRDTYVLEFIPFPSQPEIRLATGDPFKEIERLITEEKGIEIIDPMIFKGGSAKTMSIEIKLSEKIGLHDVTVIKVNDISGFTDWVKNFLKKKGIDNILSDLDSFYRNAEDYVNRGINYFVIDYVTVKTETRLVEPLVYRFKSETIYYPLKASNIVGGEGIIDLIFICPGSFPTRNYFPLDKDRGVIFEVSNSSRIYIDEIEKIYPEARDLFSKTEKLYIQVMRYSGTYNFQVDFFYDPNKLDPRPYIWEQEFFLGYMLKPAEEDYKKNLFYSYPYLSGFEYEVYKIIFTSKSIKEIISEEVNLVNITLKKQLDTSLAEKFGRAIIEDFNIKNEREYEINNLWIPGSKDKLSDRTQIITLISRDRVDFLDKVFYVSRVGFNMNKTKALVYLEEVTDGTQRTTYLVLLTRKNWQDKWKIAEVYKL
ncbi:MAG: hypothetical protein ACP5K2_02450 [bacterium]